jgi:hypothetical protein
LAVGCWLLAVGCWLLAVGCWLLAVGCWLFYYHEILLSVKYLIDYIPIIFLSIPYKDTGHTFAQTQEAFGVKPGSYYAWKKELEETGKFENHYPQNRKGKTDSEKLKEMAGKPS